MVRNLTHEKFGNYYVELDFDGDSRSDYWFRTERDLKIPPYKIGDYLLIRHNPKQNNDIVILAAKSTPSQ